MPVPRTAHPPQPPWDYISKLVCIGDSGTGKSSLTVRLCESRFSPTHDVTIGVEFGSRIVPVGPPANRHLSINNTSFALPQSNDSPAIEENGSSPSNNTAASPKDNQLQKKMKLSLWDTAGQETYKSVTRSYFRGASGALLVFDLSRRATFDSVTTWLADLRAIAEEDIVVVLVGNKQDLISDDDDGEGEDTNHDDTNPKTPTPNGLKRGSKRAVSRAEAQAWCTAQGVMTYVETSAKSGAGVERAFLEVAERIYQNVEAGRYDLADRRSGVKGYGVAGGGGGNARTGGSGGGGGAGLKLDDPSGNGSQKGAMGGCC